MRDLVWTLAVVVAATQPVGAAVYVLDAALIAGGDTIWLAISMVVALLAFVPLAWAVLVTDAGVVMLWWALGRLAARPSGHGRMALPVGCMVGERRGRREAVGMKTRTESPARRSWAAAWRSKVPDRLVVGPEHEAG